MGVVGEAIKAWNKVAGATTRPYFPNMSRVLVGMSERQSSRQFLRTPPL